MGKSARNLMVNRPVTPITKDIIEQFNKESNTCYAHGRLRGISYDLRFIIYNICNISRKIGRSVITQSNIDGPTQEKSAINWMLLPGLHVVQFCLVIMSHFLHGCQLRSPAFVVLNIINSRRNGRNLFRARKKRSQKSYAQVIAIALR